ncbi:hypothetical protein [Lysinibacillus xylanilyticus]|uniref:hypothetical protein n=1 Tax=Lysinibacillus xylanilyticus TaxID=582475 RepID=UPI003D033105
MSIGIHGTKKKYFNSTIQEGILRKNSAWFIFNDETESKVGTKLELRRSVFLSLYFALSVSTIKHYNLHKNKLSIKEFLLLNEDLIPILVFFQYQMNTHHSLNHYNINFTSYTGSTLPYTKVEYSDPVSPKEIIGFIDTKNIILNVIEDYNDKAEIIPEERFFRKVNNFNGYPFTGLNAESELAFAKFCALIEPHISIEVKKYL